jgi:hypothetical protein
MNVTFPSRTENMSINRTSDGRDASWCSIETKQNDKHGHGVGRWGYCLVEDQELVPQCNPMERLAGKCTDQYHHTCTVPANYGGGNRGVVYGPHETCCVYHITREKLRRPQFLSTSSPEAP